jgi:hypothetical protein
VAIFTEKLPLEFVELKAQNGRGSFEVLHFRGNNEQRLWEVFCLFIAL